MSTDTGGNRMSASRGREKAVDLMSVDASDGDLDDLERLMADPERQDRARRDIGEALMVTVPKKWVEQAIARAKRAPAVDRNGVVLDRAR